MTIFSKEKKVEVNRTLEETQEDLKDVLKIINLFESILSEYAPELFLKPKFLALKNILRKLNSIYLKKED